jgi:glycosyltransferase involved in cell wall biosynthesis
MIPAEVAALCVAGSTFALTGFIALRAEYNYSRLIDLPPTSVTPPEVSVTIIVPARNESDVIERAICSLRELHYPNKRIVVVDDASSDDTGFKAQALGAQVLRLTGNPPPSWTGKCNACHQAAQCADSAWLLFTDADTCHDPEGLSRALSYAIAHRLDAVSLLLRQECGTLWESVVLPLAYQNFFSMLHPRKPAFNGQYILIRRDVYVRSGGFSSVRGRVMEDVALADFLAKNGYAIELLNGHDVASVRMYRDLRGLLRGMIKTSFTAARDRGVIGALLGIFLLMAFLNLMTLIAGLILGSVLTVGVALLVIVAIALGLLRWMSRFEVYPAWVYALLNPIGVSLLFGIGFISTLMTLSGRGVRWKDRTIHEQR